MLSETMISPPVDKGTTTNKIVVTSTVDGLKDINRSATCLVIWERDIASLTSDWLSRVAPGHLPCGRVLARLDQINIAIASLFAEKQDGLNEAAQLLCQDIIRLAHLYADLAKSDQVDVRLEVIQHDACQKFHLDNVALRLVTTYMGDGTQYVVPEFSEQALQEQKAYTGPLESIPEQAVAIFKGARSVSGDGIVHRSPPIQRKNQTRLFLCINAPSDASPELWQPDQ